MSRGFAGIGSGALLAALALVSLRLYAQTDAAPAAAIELKAHPAEMAPLASRNLLLAIAGAGARVVAVGARGTVIDSGDGLNWTQVETPVRATLTAVAFADAAHGWAVGHDASILHTQDGGAHWQLQNFEPALGKPFLGLLAIDAAHAYAVGAFGSFKSTADGGATWTEVEAPAVRADAKHLNAIIRLGDGELFIAGEAGTVAVSSKTGGDWQSLKLPYEGSLFGALPRGERGALVYGLRGNVFVTEDVRAGPWRKLDIGSTQTVFGASMLPSGDAALVGADGETVLIDRDGRISRAEKVKAAGAFESGSYSGVIPWRKGLLAVGEQGVSRIQLGP